MNLKALSKIITGTRPNYSESIGSAGVSASVTNASVVFGCEKVVSTTATSITQLITPVNPGDKTLILNLSLSELGIDQSALEHGSLVLCLDIPAEDRALGVPFIWADIEQGAGGVISRLTVDAVSAVVPVYGNTIKVSAYFPQIRDIESVPASYAKLSPMRVRARLQLATAQGFATLSNFISPPQRSNIRKPSGAFAVRPSIALGSFAGAVSSLTMRTYTCNGDSFDFTVAPNGRVLTRIEPVDCENLVKYQTPWPLPAMCGSVYVEGTISSGAPAFGFLTFDLAV